MLKLYTYEHCPYCEKVRRAFAEMGVEYEEVDASRGTPGSDELIALGGKQQVPFLVDGDKHMYESDDIIAYVQEQQAS